MGDRIAFGFKADKDRPTVWLYSHWGGSSRYSDLAVAVEKAHPRWSHGDYATRMAICSLIGRDGFGDETGFGIEAGDTCGTAIDYPEVLVVHWYNQTITHQDAETGEVFVEYGFEAYLNMTPYTEPA
jgi:hypothetical protein